LKEFSAPTSGFAHSKSEHEGGVTTTGESEQKIPLIPAHETDLIDQTQVIIKRSGVRQNKCAIYWYCAFLERQTVERVL
jgi:hypothetical protein